MPDYLFIFHGGKTPETQEGIDASMAAWGKWMSDHGAAFVDPGQPVGQSKTVSPDGIADNGGSNPTTGYSILRADTIEAACAIAASSPLVLDGSGSVEVAEIHPVTL